MSAQEISTQKYTMQLKGIFTTYSAEACQLTKYFLNNIFRQINTNLYTRKKKTKKTKPTHIYMDQSQK